MLSYTVPAVTFIEAQAYIDGRGLIGWPVATNDQTTALRRGQDYISREYNNRWLTDFNDASAPDIVKFAIVEAALFEVKSPGALSPSVSATTAKILTEVKGIKWTPIAGLTSGAGSFTPTLTNVDAMLAAIVSPKMRPAVLVV